jgi:hypothetical protein
MRDPSPNSKPKLLRFNGGPFQTSFLADAGRLECAMMIRKKSFFPATFRRLFLSNGWNENRKNPQPHKYPEL